MEFLNKYNLTPKKIFMVAGIVLLAIVVIMVAFSLIGASVSTVKQSALKSLAPSGAMNLGLSYDEAMDSATGSAMPELSMRNIAPTPPNGGVVTGDTSEDYEVTQYNATVETRDLAGTCAAIANLKPKDYVIFENAYQYDHGCNYTFKVTTDHTAEILDVVKGLDPKELVENTQTIKRRIDDFTSEIDILTKKKESIESTLDDAINSYDEISKVATQARDAESLAKIIDSKIRIIESLTNQRISVNAQLDRLERSKADQLDRLDYTYFYLNIYENKFIDAENLADSWKAAIKNFVSDTNRILQELSLGLVTVILVIIQYALYLFLLLIVAKFGWKLVKKIWNK